MRGTALVDNSVVRVGGDFFAEEEAFVIFLSDAWEPDDGCFRVTVAILARGVLFSAVDCRLSATALGNSSVTCAIASSRSSMAGMESTMHVTYGEGDRLLISFVNKSCPLLTGSLGTTPPEALLVLMDRPNESSPL